MAYTLKNKFRRISISVYHSLKIDKLFVTIDIGSFKKKKQEAYNCFLSDKEKNDNQFIRKIDKDIKSCYLKYLTNPQEYFLFDFISNKEEIYRSSFLSDNMKIRRLIKVTGEKKFTEELTDKVGFYNLTKSYFKREVFEFSNNTTYDVFSQFALKTRHLFAKLIASSFGSGAISVDVIDDITCENIYNRLKKTGKSWIVEERIIQHPEMAQWNKSSVNTVRIPSFLCNGDFEIVQPVMRFGRAGSIVNNAGGGGIISCIDVDSGKLTTDGRSENGMCYKTHPDSKISFKGWQLPEWNNLKILVEEIHRNVLSSHRYIGWDFAYTEKGWVLIEGNWGQFLNQYVNHVGVKQKFIKYMK